MMVAADNSRGRQAVEISTAFTVLAAITVTLRLYTRFFLVRCPGIEDYGIVLAMLCSIGLTICIAFQAKWGMGQHMRDLAPDTMQNSLKAFWASLIVYYLSLGLTKTSIILQYRRVFTTKKFQIVCCILMAFVTAYSIWTVFGSIFACAPIRAFWDKSLPSKCIDQFAMWFTNAAINILTDFALVILPIPVIQSLNLGRRQKIALTAIFAVGGFVCIVSILRLHSLVAISNSEDPTYDNSPAATWSSVETNVGIICSCLPLLRPLMTRFLPGVFTSRRSESTSPRQYATIGSTRKGVRSRSTDVMEMTRGSPVSTEDVKHDIQVVTDIEVQVEDHEGNVSGWRTPTTNTEWENGGVLRTQSSSDTLVKGTV